MKWRAAVAQGMHWNFCFLQFQKEKFCFSKPQVVGLIIRCDLIFFYYNFLNFYFIFYIVFFLLLKFNEKQQTGDQPLEDPKLMQKFTEYCENLLAREVDIYHRGTIFMQNLTLRYYRNPTEFENLKIEVCTKRKTFQLSSKNHRNLIGWIPFRKREHFRIKSRHFRWWSRNRRYIIYQHWTLCWQNWRKKFDANCKAQSVKISFN